MGKREDGDTDTGPTKERGFVGGCEVALFRTNAKVELS